ncbi:MAG TPA: SRPBCC family protein [Vicinamibacterales bacterium]|nr:SRPBCC family protein [Vicinamibacterales bacterium]
MVDVTTDILIERPPGVVSAFACDPANAPLWYGNIKRVEWQSEPVVVVGARVAFVAEFLGKRLQYTYEVVEFEPGERLVMRAADGPFPMETIYTFEETREGQTQMTLRNHGEPSGMSRLMTPMIATAMRSANTKDLAKLKEILEGH